MHTFIKSFTTLFLALSTSTVVVTAKKKSNGAHYRRALQEPQPTEAVAICVDNPNSINWEWYITSAPQVNQDTILARGTLDQGRPAEWQLSTSPPNLATLPGRDDCLVFPNTPQSTYSYFSMLDFEDSRTITASVIHVDTNREVVAPFTVTIGTGYNPFRFWVGPSEAPTSTPSVVPSMAPTPSPTSKPTITASNAPTMAPTGSASPTSTPMPCPCFFYQDLVDYFDHRPLQRCSIESDSPRRDVFAIFAQDRSRSAENFREGTAQVSPGFCHLDATRLSIDREAEVACQKLIVEYCKNTIV